MKLDLDQLRELIRILDETNLTEIEIEHDDDRIRIRRDPGSVSGMAATPSTQVAAPQPGPPVEEVDDDGDYVTSPFVGTFYRAPSPDGAPFVDIGDIVVPGQVICIVEAMKLMNEIEAEVEGKIIEVLVENGKAVEYGDRLFRIEPT